MQFKKEELKYCYDDDYIVSEDIKKFDSQGKLIYSKENGYGSSLEKKIIYNSKNKIEKEKIKKSINGSGSDNELEKRYEYFPEGYRASTYLVRKHEWNDYRYDDITDKHTPIWKELNTLNSIEEIEFKNNEKYSLTIHKKENNKFNTSIKYFKNTNKIEKNHNKTNIYDINGTLITRKTKNNKQQIVKIENFSNGEEYSENSIENIEWGEKFGLTIRKSKKVTKCQEFYNETYNDKFLYENNISCFDNEGNLLKSKEYNENEASQSYITKKWYDSKNKISESITYRGDKKSFPKTMYIREYSLQGNLEFEVCMSIKESKKTDIVYKKKIYYHQ